jgi:hypothetical protein
MDTLDPPSPLLSIGDLRLTDILAAHPTLKKSMSDFDPIYAAATLGGLMTVPKLQCNCLRLEALSHIAVAFAKGKKHLPKKSVAVWFANMSSGPCGQYEDPAEDAFTSLVITPRGNFRILAGLWESAAFYLQRVINVVEGIPAESNWNSLKESVYALLKLSDLICERAQLPRYSFGNVVPERHLPRDLAALRVYRHRVTFSDADLRALISAPESLAPFIFDPKLRAALPAASLSHSPLLYAPLLQCDGQLVVALPTAISIAIRMLIVGRIIGAGLKQPLLKAIAHEYRQFFSNHPPLNAQRGAPIAFRSTNNGVIASYAYELDRGRFSQVIFELDTLEGFEETGFAGANPDPVALSNDFDHEIDQCRRAVCAQAGFREGLTLIIGCGIGRSQMHILSSKRRADWQIAFLSAADVATLNSLTKVDSLTLWRILDAERHLAGQGVQLVNMNGLLNLISWVRSLDGHLVQHSQIPADFGRGRRCTLMIDSSMVRNLRMEVANRVDRHAVENVDGDWIEVRKTDESFFGEDRSRPLYACDKWDAKHGLWLVFLTATRQWWCAVTYPLTLDRWQIMNTWLPKIATVLDQALTELPLGPLSLLVRFGGYSERAPEGEVTSREAIQDRIRVEVDKARRVVAVETDEAFEQGLANPNNISEAALVGAVVSGYLEFAGKTNRAQAAFLQERIVLNQQARSCHAFCARHFRDFVGDSLPHDPVMIDPIDDATLRLGLGWKVRKREDAPTLEGKASCTAFLNDLVKSVENRLCSNLRAFDRESLVKLALENHEAAMVHQLMWRRTAAANLALHDAKAATMAVIGEQESKNNAVLLASRVLIELAVCECPLHGGHSPGKLDMSRLMAMLLLGNAFGGWSDAIHLDAMTPVVRITPLGDVHTDQSFFDNVVEPFGQVTNDSMIRSSVSNYSQNFEQARSVAAAEPAFEPEFASAWREEHNFGLDDFRRFVDELENLGINRKRAAFFMKQSELRGLLEHAVPNGYAIAEGLTTMPRRNWRVPPDGFKVKDLQPWRFRRPLSVLRRPIIQIDESEDPKLLIAPGLLRDSIVYSMTGYYEGSFPLSQIRSPSMRSWFGQAADRRGREFTRDVAKRMTELAWKVESEVAVTKILRKGFKVDYGDVDVLAWNDRTGRVLLIECKDLHFHKTPGELAEQLSDFRGGTRNGKRDLLKKHLDRCKILGTHANQVAAYLRLTGAPIIESFLAFRNPVPMLFAWKNLESRVRITTYEHLDRI